MITTIIIFISAMIGVGLCIYGSRRTLIIRFSYSPLDWYEPILLTSVAFVIAFALEYSLSSFLIGLLPKQSEIAFLISRFIDSGLFVPFLSAGLSCLFAKMVESLNLDYLDEYTNTVSKVCFTVIVLAFCIIGAQKTITLYDKTSKELVSILNRIFMWMVTVIGTWIGFGFQCEGRIQKMNKLRKKTKRTIDIKSLVVFWLPIVAPLGLFIIILLISFNDYINIMNYFSYFLFAFAAYLIGGIGALIICKRNTNPSIEMSEKIFLKNVIKNNKGVKTSSNFGRMKYELEGTLLRIKKVNVSYPGHEEDPEFKELFDEAVLNVDTDDYESTLCLLKERSRKQKEYIEKGFSDCIEEKKNKRIMKI